MKNLNVVAEQLFNEIRGRFPSVTIGDAEGNVTNEPKLARFYEFDFEGENKSKVSVSLEEDTGVTIMYSNDFTENAMPDVKSKWYNFLKQIRMFSKKRLLNFEVRDINRSNLTQRDYQYLATNRSGETQMSESKMYGTNKTSYQKIGNARLAIKHSSPISEETVNSRTKNIASIFIEAPNGEKFKYPFKHLAGARAMARHVSEGGTAYDDFGKHITGLSEELSNLRKFKTYMSRSNVMAESLAEHMDTVNQRITSVRKTIQNLQKPQFYTEAFEEFVPIEETDVPADVAENWIDQLTVKQFNEELKDVFPYIYKLIGEATATEELTFEDLIAEDGVDPAAVDAAVKQAMGGAPATSPRPKLRPEMYSTPDQARKAAQAATSPTAQENRDFVIKKIGTKFTYEVLVSPDQAGAIERGNRASQRTAQDLETLSTESQIDMAFDKLLGQFADNFSAQVEGEQETDEGNAYAHAVRQAKMNGKKKGDEVDGPDGEKIKLEKEQKTPLGEFILSYFDRQTGQFPKGETAVLTSVEKDYGDQYVKPASQFIERLGQVYEKYQARKMADFTRIQELAGLR